MTGEYNAEPWAPVRFTVTQIDTSDLAAFPRPVLYDVKVAAEDLPETARTWILQRGYDTGSLPRAVVDLLSREAPRDGFFALINKPHGLLFFATWPWAKSSEFDFIAARPPAPHA